MNGFIQHIPALKRPAFTLTAAIALSVLLASVVSRSEEKTSAPPAQTAEYVLRPMDTIDVTVYRQDDLNKTLRIAPNGTIDYPLVSRFKAAGHSVDYVADVIKKGLQEKYIQDPLVTVSVVEYAPRKAYIWGEVVESREIELPLDRPISLTQAIAMAGNFTKDANRRKVLLYRKTPDGKHTSLEVDVEDITEKHDFDKDVVLQPGDTVYVPTLGGFFVRGAVRKPGYYAISSLNIPPNQQPTVSMAIALAEDFDPDANRKRVRLIRYLPGDPDPTVLTVDMEDIVKHQRYEKDIPIRSGDMIFVPARDGVFVTGEVNKSGMYKPMPGQKLTVLKAISLAGGFSQWAGKKSLRVYRVRNNKTISIKVNLIDFLKKDNLDKDIELESGDILYVPQKGIFE